MKTGRFFDLIFASAIGIVCFSAGAAQAASPERVRLGVGFIPNVQFAPLYVSQQKGFYAKEGLEVEIEYGYESDFVALVAQGEREFAIASGDQVILARGQGLPITYVMKWFERYPVALVAPKSGGIEGPADLPGKTVGLPAFSGASFVGWKALLYASGIDEAQLTVKRTGFAQVAALQRKIVDAAMVYIANEPIQLRDQGMKVNVIEVSDYIGLVSNGLVASDRLTKENPDLVRRMVRATLRGVTDTVANPQEAFDIARRTIPEITDSRAEMQRTVLRISIELWKGSRPGFSDKKEWRASADFLYETGLSAKKVPVDRYYTNQFVE